MRSIFEVNRYQDSLVPTDSRLFEKLEDAKDYAQKLAEDSILEGRGQKLVKDKLDGHYTIFETDIDGWSESIYCQIFVSNRRVF